jgi:gluconate 2-dehydrogenase gamma chain
MTDVKRRELLKLAAAAPLAAGFAWTAEEVVKASGAVAAAAQTKAPFRPAFFTEHEYATVAVLVDLIIPRDDQSGSATEAGVPEFMDFMMIDDPTRQTPMRGGLAWLDLECLRRYDKTFLAAAAAERTAVLDDISWPTRAKPEFSHGIRFFSNFRNLTASGFFSSKIGIADLKYLGNAYVAKWTGCPDDVLKKLGVAPGVA